MVTRPTLSVLIAYFNERELLRECLESLLAQDVLPDEIIVFDNGSDASPEPYIPQDKGIRLLRDHPNRGPAYAHNRLLAAATGDYIHFHDSDDLFAPGWIRRVQETIEQAGVDAVFTDAMLYRGSEPVAGSRYAAYLSHAEQDWVRFCIEASPMMGLSTVRREWALRLGFREALRISDDTDFHIRLAASGAWIAALPEPLLIHRIRADGWSSDPVACFQDVAEQYAFLVRELPAQHRLSLARQAVYFGRSWYAHGERKLARRFFGYARALGAKPSDICKGMYGVAASVVGFEAAEHLSVAYRKLSQPVRFTVGRAWRTCR